MDSSRQKQHYTQIHDAYEAHYYDEPSMEYRSRFIYDWLFARADLSDKRIADLACGSGFNSRAIMERYANARTVGFDISDPACELYRHTTGNDAYVIDLTKPYEPAESFDGAIVIGGLHHCVADLPETIRNVARLVKPGGRLLMMEPSADFALNTIRDRWYDSDRYFDAQTERALSHDEILRQAEPYFESEAVRYFGGPAYFVILNSLILRVPLKAKPALWTVLRPLEIAFGSFPWRGMYPCFLAVWRRTSAALPARA